MYKKPFITATLLCTLITATQAEEPMLGGVSFSYTPFINSAIKIDGLSTKHDEGARYAIHLREYYFANQSHHPFAELAFYYEEDNTRINSTTLDTETIALNFSAGSAIPLWHLPDQALIMGISPEIGLNIGQFRADLNYSTAHSHDDSFQYGVTGGVVGWAVINRNFALNLGLVGGYWRATGITVVAPDGMGGTVSRSTSPTGWNVGVRIGAGFLF